MTKVQEVSPIELGKRLRISRDAARITQIEAAEAIDVSRPTIAAIEKGERRLRVTELQLLAKLYSVSVNSLLRREAVYSDLLPRFRKLNESENETVLEAVRLLNRLVSAEVELENALGVPRVNRYPIERPLKSGNVVAQAKEHAASLRAELGIGPGPVGNIFRLLEEQLGIRVYQRRLRSSPKVSGLFSYDTAMGACILINADHPLPRRTLTAAHELGHFIGTRQAPEVLELGERFLSREEKYANAFSYAFLTPEDDLRSKFGELTRGASKLTRRHIILLSHHFGVSREAMIRRLEELQLAPTGTWAWFVSNGQITDAQAREVLGADFDTNDDAKLDADNPFPMRVGLMAYEAWQRELISEGQVARMFDVNRIDIRKYFDQLQEEERVTDDLFKLDP
ncbi:MAG: XRE family transcriptional regulator [Pseudomonadota bacterium]